MMDLLHYFDPVDFEKFACPEWANKKHTLGYLLQRNQEKVKPEKADLVLIGVPEDRNSGVEGAAKAPDEIRKHLYNLNRIGARFKILDLGNLKVGNTANDSYFALRDICEHLMESRQTVCILGGSQDLTFGMSKAFDGRLFNMVTVDPKLDFKKGVKNITAENYLNLIFEKQKNMYSYTALGYQNYFVDQTDIDIFNSSHFDSKRLGQVRYDLTSVEPILRDANIFSFDINAIRYIDAPGQAMASPNGLYSEEACQIARYAGISDTLQLAGFFNLIPDNDMSSSSSNLVAQIIWHFIEGFYNRKPEDPTDDTEDFNHFVVDMADINIAIVFFQSRVSGRWWMEISDFEHKKGRMYIVPCDEDDYKKASQGDIPDRWWKNIRKMHKRQNK
ncbi:MAG TPA: formimidoylglutamase [Prolixibacteraceae bacterium]|jgi:arginase family enzyme|nr:formimidoylglutamase [Prolixibacteraceae bacterium]